MFFYARVDSSISPAFCNAIFVITGPSNSYIKVAERTIVIMLTAIPSVNGLPLNLFETI